MLSVLRNLCRRPAIRFGLRCDSRGRFRDPQFVSFMTYSNRRVIGSDRQDALRWGRRLVGNCLRLAVVGGGAWVVLESARALSVF